MTAKEVEKLINFLGQMANLPLVDGERKLSNFVYTIITTQRDRFKQFFHAILYAQKQKPNPLSESSFKPSLPKLLD